MTCPPFFSSVFQVVLSFVTCLFTLPVVFCLVIFSFFLEKRVFPISLTLISTISSNIIFVCAVIAFFFSCYCDAPNSGCPLTTRQPAEIYMSHVMRPIHVQKWPLGPTHHTHKMYILYKNDLITICFQLYLITIYTKTWVSCPEFYKNTK